MDYIQEEEYEKEPPKKDKKIVILIIVIVLLVLAIAGILLYFLVIKKDNSRAHSTTTTTKTYDFKIPRNLSEYEMMIKGEIRDNESRELILQDKSFKKINIRSSCTSTEAIKDTQDNHEIEYDCTYYMADEAYEYFVTIDKKFRFKEHSEYTCGNPLYYIGDNYLIYYLPSCAPGENKLVIYNQYQGESFKAGYDAPYVNTYEFYETNNKHYRPFIKDGYLFFLASQNTGDENNQSTCNVYRMNLSNNKLTYDLSSPFECNYGA